MARFFLLCGFSLLALSAWLLNSTQPDDSGVVDERWQVAQKPATKSPPVVFTFIGRKGGRTEVIDHRVPGGSRTEVSGTNRRVNVLSPEAMERAAAARAAALARDEEETTEEGAGGEVAAEEAVAPVVGEEPEEEIDVQKGLRDLRKHNWITFTEDDNDVPTMVYNPLTKQFVSTLDAIRSLPKPEDSKSTSKTAP